MYIIFHSTTVRFICVIRAEVWLEDDLFWFLIFVSLGQRSRSQGPEMLKWFLLIILKVFISKSSYFTLWLIITGRWPLLIFVSLGQRSRSQGPWMLKLFPLIILKVFITKSLYFTWWFNITSRWPLLILGSQSQRSRSQGS
jgi:hypothetical protein